MEHIRDEDLFTSIRDAGLEVISMEEKIIQLRGNYTIEIEGAKLFKLKHEGCVIAPFDDVLEMCTFIKMDMELNEEN